MLTKEIGSVADERNQIRRTARVSPPSRCCCFFPPLFRSNLSSAKVSDRSDLSFHSPCGPPVSLQMIFSIIFASIFCNLGCHIWKPRFSRIWLFTSSSGSSASSTFFRFADTVVPFVRASDFARVSGSLKSGKLLFQQSGQSISKRFTLLKSRCYNILTST